MGMSNEMRIKMLQIQIDQGIYRCPAVALVEALLKKNTHLETDVKKVEKELKFSEKKPIR